MFTTKTHRRLRILEQQFVKENRRCAEPIDSAALLDALREIKLTALTTMDAPKGLAHIVRICIDAGVTEKLDALMASNASVDNLQK